MRADQSEGAAWQVVSSAASALADMLARLQLCLAGAVPDSLLRQAESVLQHMQAEISGVSGVWESAAACKGNPAAQQAAGEALKVRGTIVVNPVQHWRIGTKPLQHWRIFATAVQHRRKS